MISLYVWKDLKQNCLTGPQRGWYGVHIIVGIATSFTSTKRGCCLLPTSLNASFMQDPRSILCHPHADQQIPVWINKLYNHNESLANFDDRRLHLYPPAKTLEKFNNLSQVCDSYLGVHGSSPEMMLNFGRLSGDGPKSNSSLKLTTVTKTCHFPNVFDISKITGPYKFELRPCLTNPRWTPNEEMWLGIHSGGNIKT